MDRLRAQPHREARGAHLKGEVRRIRHGVGGPRWTQKRERRIPDFFARCETLLFNGYGDQVASLYAGMHLKKFY